MWATSKRAIRWSLLILLCLVGASYIVLAFQNEMFSFSQTAERAALSRVRADVFLPIGVLFIISGFTVFRVLR